MHILIVFELISDICKHYIKYYIQELVLMDYLFKIVLVLVKFLQKLLSNI